MAATRDFGEAPALPGQAWHMRVSTREESLLGKDLRGSPYVYALAGELEKAGAFVYFQISW
jgi:hypothetical protein